MNDENLNNIPNDKNEIINNIFRIVIKIFMIKFIG